MEDKRQSTEVLHDNAATSNGVFADVLSSARQAVVSSQTASYAPQPLSQPLPTTPDATPGEPHAPENRHRLRKILFIIAIIIILLLLVVGGWWVVGSVLNRPEAPGVNGVASRFNVVQIPLDEVVSDQGQHLLGTRSLTINGPLTARDSFILSPSGQPSNANRGQIYYDQNSNELAYFNGSEFVTLSSSNNVVQSIGGSGGEFTLGNGLTSTGGQLANSGVLSLQGQTGNVTLVAGPGIAVDGTTISSTGILSLGGVTGDITLGNGLNLTDGVLENAGVISAAGGSGISVTDDGNGNITITNSGAGTGTVQSPGGTPGRLAKFTGVQTIEDSLVSEAGTVVTVGGDLSVTGELTLGTALSVGNGGTGATSLALNGVVIGQGTNALSAVTAGGVGLCLLSTAGAPAFQACPGGASVTSVNGLTGALTIANASGAGTTITIDNASTVQKGIAQFNATNFSVAAGIVNTIQNINTGASPTFVNQTLTGDLAVNGGDITSTGALNMTATTAFTLQGNASSVINATDGVNTTTLAFQSPTANVTYRFPTAAAGTYDVCTMVGNCAGVGGGVTTVGGTTNRIAKFTGSQAIGDSLLSESGSTVTVSGNLNLTTGNQYQINGTQISSADLSNDANIAKLNASQTFTGNTNTFRNGANSTTAFSIQNAATNRLLTADTTNGEIELGQSSTLDGRLVFNNAANTNTITIIPSTATANRTITLPDDSGTVCLSTGNCAGAGVTLQSAYNNSTSPEITVDATRGALTIRDAATPIGANLLEVQNNAGSTTYFAVTSSGTSTTGSATATGNINTSGGSLQTNGTTRVDNSGNATNIGNISLSGSISGGTTYSGSGNINTTGGALQTAGTTRVDNSGNLVNIGNITGTGAITIASSGAGNDIVIDGADQFIVQDAAVFNALSTFTSDVDMTFAGSENLSITNTVTGTTALDLVGAVLTNNTSSGTQQVALLQNAAGSGTTEGLLVLDNADTDTAVTNGLQITSAAGGITTAVDVSDPDIVTALLFGANDITGTNFSVTGSSGDLTSAGNATLQGGTITVGTGSQAGELVLHDGSSNTGALQVAALGQDTTYILPDPGTGTATICLTTGNCAGTGGGVTGSGTNNRLAKFTATGSTIGDSTITDNGTSVTTSVDVVVQGGDLTIGTTSQLASLLLHDGNGQTTSLQAGDSSGNLTFILPTTAGSTNQCLKQSGTGNQLVWDSCDGGGGGSSATLQGAYNNGNTITTTDARDIDITLANTATDSNFDLVVADGSTSFVSFTRADGSGTADPAQMLLVDNLDGNRTLPIGIKLQASAGGMATAIDASDAEIVDAVSVGANNVVGTTGNIDFTNFDVVGATGNITTAGDLAVNGGDITSSGALTVTSGGNIALNATGTIELQDDTNVTGNLDVSGTLTSGSANAFQVASGGDITTAGDATLQGGLLTVGTSSQGGAVVLYDGSTHTGSLSTASLSDNRTYTLPDESGTICLSTGNCAGAAVTLQAAYDNSTSPEITLDSTRGALTIRDNASAIGGNLLEVQNNAGGTTYFGVTASGVSVTGTATVSGNINTSGGTLQTAGTNRVDNGGNLVNIGNITGTGAITIASSGAGNDIVINGADILDVQDATTFASTATFNGAATFNTDVDLVLADTENLSIVNTVTGTNSVDVISTTLTNNTSSGTQNGAVIRNAAGTGTTEALLVLDNADTDTVVTTALQVTAAAGGVTTAIDLSDADITDAINMGANNIVGTTGNIDLTNFDVAGSSGNVTMAGILEVGTLGTANTATILCRNASNQIAACAGTGSGAAWVQGGNSFGATGVIGTNDNFGINIRVNTTTVASFLTDGSLNLRNSTNGTQGFDVENASGANIFTIDTVNSRAGINLGGSTTPTLDSAGLEINGGLRLSGGTLDDAFTTPLSATIGAKINIPIYNPGSGNTIIAAGLTSTADNSATVIGVFDARTNANHWPTIAVYSPDESKLAGLTWAGSNTEARVTTHNATGTSAGIALQSGDTAGSTTSTGAVAVRSGNGVGSDNSTGAISIDSGTPTGSGTAGAITIGTTNAPSVTIGRSGASGTTTVQGGTGGVSLLSAANVTIGTSNTTGTLLVLDTKTDAGDPTGVNGGMYYNSNSGTFRCYQAGSWTDCVSSSSTFIQNQNASDQTANFRISGSGQAATSFLAPALDVASAGTLSIGTSTATGITLGSSTNNPLITLESGTSNIDIGAGHFARTIRVGTSNQTQTISIGGIGANLITLGNAQTGGGVSIGTNMTTGSVAIGGGTISIGTGAQARIVTLGTGAANQTVTVGSTNGSSSLTLQAGTGNFVLNGVAGTTYTIGAATTTGTISLGGTAQTGSITIGGGTGAQSINLGTGGTGAKTVTVGSSASTGLTTIQGGTGGVSLLSAANVTIGTSDTTGTLLVLDTKTDAGDPTGVNGGMYYNSNSNTFRCYQNGSWTNCISAAVGATLQTAYDSSTGGTTPEIKLDSTRGGLDIQDADTTIGANLINVRASNGSGLGTLLFGVSNAGAVTVAGTATLDLTTNAVSTANGTGNAFTIAAGDSTSSTCGTACTGGDLFLQGGNATGASGMRNGGSVHIDAGIGNNNNGQILIGNGSSADITIGRTSGGSATLLQAGGIVTLESGGSSSTSRIQIGTGGAGVTTPDYLALDVKSTTGDPGSGAEGYIYYNTVDNKFRCYQGTGWTDCITASTGVTAIGAMDSQTKSANGAVISGGTLYMQTADGTSPGLVSAGTQTLAGAKTFTSATTFQAGLQALNSGVVIFELDLANSRVYVGNPTADTTGALLVLDTKSDAGDPTGVNGGMYYNSNSGVFRCYEVSAWHDCAGGTLGYAQVTANQAINATPADLTGLSVTVTVPANHRIRISAHVAMGGSLSDDAPAVRIHESTTQLQECHHRVVATNSGDALACSVVLTPSSGSHTYNLKGVIANGGGGTGNLYASSTKPAYILVEDIGK